MIFFSLIKFGFSNCHGGFGSYLAWKGCNSNEGDRLSAYGELKYTSPDSSDPAGIVNDIAKMLTSGRLNQGSRDIITDQVSK